MSKYLTEHSLDPCQARDRRLDAGAASITIEHNNGAVEVTNSNGAVLMQARNVPEGTFNKIWKLLEANGDIDYRAK